MVARVEIRDNVRGVQNMSQALTINDLLYAGLETIVVTVIAFVCWEFVSDYYSKKILKMKPEVKNDES